MLSQCIRQKGFEFIDFLSGKPVMGHYKDIEYYWQHPEKIADFQSQQFSMLAQFAINNVEFYKGMKGIQNPELSDFPIIDKSIIKANHDALCSHKATEKGCVEMHTSGSTGTPLVVFHDKNKRDRVYAEMMYMWGLSGYKIGMKYAFLRRWNNINKKSAITAFARNLLMVDVSLLNESTFCNIKDLLSKPNKVQMMIGYASTLGRLADYLLNNGCTPEMFELKTIFSGSEVLTETTKNKLKSVFGCNVVSLYSNQENGMLAVECNDNKEFHLNEASYIFEILKLNSDEPAEIGEIGRIVVTDLFNYAMPLIRYDTGDLTIKKAAPDCNINTSVISAIEGRRVDIVYDVNGTPLSPHTITNGLWKFDKLSQFQLVQEEKALYIFRVNDPLNAYSDDELVSACKDFFGESATIIIERINDIPVLSSGKFKYLVCNI